MTTLNLHRLTPEAGGTLLSFIRDPDVPEIHGFTPEYGYRVYTDKAIEMARPLGRPDGSHCVCTIPDSSPKLVGIT